MRHRLVQHVLVEFAFGAADDDAGDAIANQICKRRHSLMNLSMRQDGNRLDRKSGTMESVAASVMKPAR